MGQVAAKRCCRLNASIGKEQVPLRWRMEGSFYHWQACISEIACWRLTRFQGPEGREIHSTYKWSCRVQTEKEKRGRRGKLQLHAFHLTAAAKFTAALWPISGARRGRKTVPITVSPITGHSTATAVNTRRVMVCVAIFSLMFGQICSGLENSYVNYYVMQPRFGLEATGYEDHLLL